MFRKVKVSGSINLSINHFHFTRYPSTKLLTFVHHLTCGPEICMYRLIFNPSPPSQIQLKALTFLTVLANFGVWKLLQTGSRLSSANRMHYAQLEKLNVRVISCAHPRGWRFPSSRKWVAASCLSHCIHTHHRLRTDILRKPVGIKDSGHRPGLEQVQCPHFWKYGVS